MAEFDWQTGQLPEGWQRGDQLRIMNDGFRDGPRSALMHVPAVYVFDSSRKYENDVAAVAFYKDDIPKVKAWLEWYRGEMPLKEIFK